MLGSLMRAATTFIVVLALSWSTLGTPAQAGGSVDIQVFAPKSGDVAGVVNRAFLVDLVARFDGDLASTRAVPGVKAAGAPGANPNFPGLVVLLSGTKFAPPTFNGPGQNLANAFNIIAVTDRDDNEKTDIWTTWFVGAANFGSGPSRLFVAIVAGDAPNVIDDVDGNGVIDEKDLRRLGFTIISNVRKIDFVINSADANGVGGLSNSNRH